MALTIGTDIRRTSIGRPLDPFGGLKSQFSGGSLGLFPTGGIQSFFKRMRCALPQLRDFGVIGHSLGGQRGLRRNLLNIDLYYDFLGCGEHGVAWNWWCLCFTDLIILVVHCPVPFVTFLGRVLRGLAQT